MLPSYYEYYNPVKIISGNKALDNLPYELSQLNAQKPLIITDKGVVKAGLMRHVTVAFDAANMDVGAIYDEVPPDSSNQVVNQIADVFRHNDCDAIVAVGGGSPIDTAKAVNIVVTENADDLLAFEGADRLKTPQKPFIVIPTTAGTGSEVTLAAVIKNTEKKIKMTFSSPLLLPKVAIIDPRMTLTMPPHITAATGMDALTHAMEGYTCLQKNPLSDAHAYAGIKLIRTFLIRAVKDGKDAEARVGMANAATMAGAAFSNSMVGMIHSLGHATGAVCSVPHGVAMSIFLPFGLEYNLEKTENAVAELLLPFGGEEEYAKTAASKRARRTIALVREFQQTLKDLCGLPMTLEQAGVPKDKLEDIAKAAINDGTLVYNPVEMDLNDALGVLNAAYQ
ncbi:MAG: iron-containing alcohol dehydrogenase [Myxococcota bacterium]|nr:iron-containing alcohol dehydrogenase [Myxococcota bacterium]